MNVQYGSLAILPSYTNQQGLGTNPNSGHLSVSGNVIICGTLEVQGKTIMMEEYKNQILEMKSQNEVLQKKLDILTDMVNKLWYSPGMPGFIETQQEWNDKVDELYNTY